MTAISESRAESSQPAGQPAHTAHPVVSSQVAPTQPEPASQPEASQASHPVGHTVQTADGHSEGPAEGMPPRGSVAVHLAASEVTGDIFYTPDGSPAGTVECDLYQEAQEFLPSGFVPPLHSLPLTPCNCGRPRVLKATKRLPLLRIPQLPSRLPPTPGVSLPFYPDGFL